MKYGLPQAAATLCKTASEKVWKNAVFMVFDIPNKQVPFEVCFYTSPSILSLLATNGGVVCAF